MSNQNERDDTDSTPQAPPETDKGATAVAGAVKPARPKPRMLPPFKVLLHNDEVNDFEHVIRCIVKLTSLSLEEAVEKTFEAHNTGVALLLVTHRERAELYCEQFATFKLTVTSEPEV